MSILPISSIINVSITNTPSGISEQNVNTVGLFSTETPNNVDVYRSYISAAQVAVDYGTNSITAAMANNVFAQTPNLRSGSGELVIMPLVSSVSATAGDTITTDISANLAAIQAVADGDLKVTLNGTDYDLSGLNFTAAADFTDIAKVIQTALPNGIVTAIANTGFKVESKKVGATADAIIATFAGSGTDLAGASLFNTAASTPTSGADATGETISEAIARTEGQVFYAGVMTNLLVEDAEISVTAATVQSRDLMFIHQSSSAEDIAGIGTTIQAASQDKTRLLVYTLGVAEANLMKAAFVGRAFSVNFNGTATSQTMQLKQLVNVVADLGINQTLLGQAEVAGTDLYVSYRGRASVESTGGNDYFDNVYNDLQLKFSLETAGFNHLAQTNTKIPQTEAGMDGLKSSYATAIERFVSVGVIAAGSWTSSETFGDPEIFKENIEQFGYYIYSVPITQQSAAERALRKAPLVQVAIKRAGAIHRSDVIVLVND